MFLMGQKNRTLVTTPPERGSLTTVTFLPLPSSAVVKVEYSLSCPTTNTMSMLSAWIACINDGNPSSSIQPQVFTIIPEARASTSRARRSLTRWPTCVIRVLYSSGFSFG